ncbi:MAG: hypothetical protein PHD81_01395 [Candidatus Nanoarchaeia archaeon]|nr:hypothetical protein [Candidatus Nanoarchaeia archaeon]MDD5587743.1 hypothetical protein [Candidatus Nanoarchaeia archaeon]
MLRLEIPKEDLVNLYEKEKLTTFQIAEKLNCCQATIWKRLKEYDIKTRISGIERVKITKEKLFDLYINKKYSTWKIEKITEIPRGTIHRKLKEFGIQSRDISDSHIIYEKRDFSGDPLEKAYLIGFRIGDLGVRKRGAKSKLICVASGSTIEEQIILIKNLFKNYGKVWIKKSKNNKINVYVYLNLSFGFLLDKKIPKELEKNKKLFFAFLGGFTDAEGSMKLNKNMAYYSLGNYDSKLLFKIYNYLNKYGIKCNKPHSDNRIGTFNSQGYKYNSNYWTLKICRKEELYKLLKELKPHIKHKNKIKDLNIVENNLIERIKS